MSTTLPSIVNVGEYAYWVRIDVYSKGSPCYGADETLLWVDLTWPVRSKWDWYFKYRGALLQVKYPRARVDYKWGSGPATGHQLEAHRRNVVIAKKAKVTQVKNRLDAAQAAWQGLFPIENEPSWKKSVARLERAYAELLEAQERANLPVTQEAKALFNPG